MTAIRSGARLGGPGGAEAGARSAGQAAGAPRPASSQARGQAPPCDGRDQHQAGRVQARARIMAMTAPAKSHAAVNATRARVPDFFIVGAPKSGTTSLYRTLRQHPRIFMPDLKEPRFLASDAR